MPISALRPPLGCCLVSALLLAGGCHKAPEFDQRYAAESARIENQADSIRRDIDMRLRAAEAARPTETGPAS